MAQFCVVVFDTAKVEYNFYSAKKNQTFFIADRSFSAILSLLVRCGWFFGVVRGVEWFTEISNRARKKQSTDPKTGTPPKNNLISITALEWMSLSFYIIKMIVLLLVLIQI